MNYKKLNYRNIKVKKILKFYKLLKWQNYERTPNTYPNTPTKTSPNASQKRFRRSKRWTPRKHAKNIPETYPTAPPKASQNASQTPLTNRCVCGSALLSYFMLVFMVCRSCSFNLLRTIRQLDSLYFHSIDSTRFMLFGCDRFHSIQFDSDFQSWEHFFLRPQIHSRRNPLRKIYV